MKISVIMPVYNGEKSLEKALDSILNQTFKDFEFIIVDDGSTDNTPQILNNYGSKDKRIRIIKNSKNIGLTLSLNLAIEQSEGEFIARQDADDESYPERLEKQYQFLKENSDYAFCGSDGIFKQSREKFLKYFELEDIRKNLIRENCFTHSTILIRKSILDEYGLYDDKFLYGQDYELWSRLIYRYQLKAKNLRDPLITMDIPLESLRSKNKRKFVIQNKNKIKTKLRNLRYSKNKIRGMVSILSDVSEIAYVMVFNRKK